MLSCCDLCRSRSCRRWNVLLYAVWRKVSCSTPVVLGRPAASLAEICCSATLSWSPSCLSWSERYARWAPSFASTSAAWRAISASATSLASLAAVAGFEPSARIWSCAVALGVVTLTCRASAVASQPWPSLTHTAASTSWLVAREMNRWARNWSACMATSTPWLALWPSSIETSALASYTGGRWTEAQYAAAAPPSVISTTSHALRRRERPTVVIGAVVIAQAPLRADESTAGTVMKRILRSSQGDASRTYRRSRSIISVADRRSRRLTCQRPVRPGGTLRRWKSALR